MHGDYDLSDFCEGSDWMVVSTGWAGSVGSDWTWPLDPKTRACWAPGAIRMILLHGESCNITALPNMAGRGKVYASWSYHARLSASTAVARVSGTGDPNKSNLLLNQVPNKSIWGQCHLCYIAGKTSWRRDHFAGWSGLAWIACLLPHSVGLECVGLWVTWLLVHQVKTLHIRAQHGPDLMLPSLFIYDTTVVLSVSTSTILCMHFKVRKTALSSK